MSIRWCPGSRLYSSTILIHFMEGSHCRRSYVLGDIIHLPRVCVVMYTNVYVASTMYALVGFLNNNRIDRSRGR